VAFNKALYKHAQEPSKALFLDSLEIINFSGELSGKA
jgi:hypothetical protein